MFYQILTIIVCLLFKGHYSLFTKNNACKTYGDYLIKDIGPNCFYNPDVGKNAPEILQNHVEYYENHTVTTEDGYILKIFRIPKEENRKGIVMLAHALTADSTTWIAESNTSLAFLLWNQGYEVWLPNQRGTYFSDKHINLTTSNFEFWNYTFHEVGIYDYSAVIKHIAQVTNNNEIIFIGHSQSSTSSLIYAALKPEEAKKYVKVFIVMSPITSLSYMRSPARFFAWLRNPLLVITNFLKIGSFLRYNSLEAHIYRAPLHLPFKRLLIWLTVDSSSGWTPNEMDPTWYSSIFTVQPRGISIKMLAHYAQFVKGVFNQYDYGEKGNLIEYNAQVPPEYPVWNIKTPVYIIASDKDSIGTLKDAEDLFSKLSEEARIYGMIKTTKLNHADFYFGKDKKEYAYDIILRFLDRIL